MGMQVSCKGISPGMTGMRVAVPSFMPRLASFGSIGFCALSASACTTLGPMPGVTGATVVPESRPGAEVQAAFVPGYFLSEATQEGKAGADNRFPSGTTLQQLSGFIEPGKLVHLPGLSVGGRYVSGGDGPGYFEPMLRYRAEVVDGLALGAVGYGTRASGSAEGASYSAIRGGVEASADFRVLPKSRWVEIHLTGGGSLTGLSAEGRYCQDENGFGRSCATSPSGIIEPANAAARIQGAYPTGFGGLALDFAKHSGGIFHGVRFVFLTAVGTMPSVRFGEAQPATMWTSWGLGLSVAMGLPEASEAH